MSTDNKENKKRVRRKRRRRKGRRTIHHVVLILFVLVVGVVLSLTVFFKIQEISVDNIDHYTDEEIVAASGLALETNLFLADVDKARDNLLLTFPYIEEATVKRGLPPKVDISIYASVPAAALEYGGHEYALITSSGKVLEKGLVLLPPEVLLVRGVNVGGKEPGDYLGRYTAESIPKDATDALTAELVERNKASQLVADEEADALYVINYMIEAIHVTGFTAVTNVDLTNPLDMRVVYENRLLLKLGTELNLEYKLRALQRAIELQHPKAHGTLNVENLTNTAKTIFTPAEGYDRHGTPLAEEEEKEAKEKAKEKEKSELEDPQGDSPLQREEPVPLEPEGEERVPLEPELGVGLESPLEEVPLTIE